MRVPTSCSPHGKPARVVPHGSEIAGWPVRLNSCVSRSMTLRTGSLDATDLHGCGADRRRGNRDCRQHQRVVAGQRAVHLAARTCATLQCPDVVLGEHVARHLQSQANGRRVAIGHRFQRVRVVRRGIAEHEVHVDRWRCSPRVGMSTSPIVAPPARKRSSVPSKAVAHFIVEEIAEVSARDREALTVDWRRDERPAGSSGRAARESMCQASVTLLRQRARVIECSRQRDRRRRSAARPTSV